MGRWVDRVMDRQTDRQTDKTDRQDRQTRQTDKTDRQDRQTRQTDRQTDRQPRQTAKTDRQTRQTDRQDRQTDKTDRQAGRQDRQTDRQTDSHSLADILHDTKNLQRKLNLDRTKHTLSTFLQGLESTGDKACPRSLQRRGAGAWLDAIPTSTKFALSSGDYCLAQHLRLGCYIVVCHCRTDHLRQCECRQ